MSSARPHWSVHGDSRAQANFRKWKLTSSGTSVWHVSLKQRNLSGHCSLGGTTVDHMDSTTTCPILQTSIEQTATWSDFMILTMWLKTMYVIQCNRDTATRSHTDVLSCAIRVSSRRTSYPLPLPKASMAAGLAFPLASLSGAQRLAPHACYPDTQGLPYFG